MPKYQAIRGTKDILPPDSAQFQHLEAQARALFARFGYEEIRTPTFEAVDLFQRSLGETTDVVQKEMYVFEDRGGRKLALRPEGTAGVVRAFIEHHLSQTTPFCKLFYMGPMFRAERPQAGRYREFWQIGAEYFGNASPAADAELLVLLEAFFVSLGIPDSRLKLNSLGDQECRPKYLSALKTYIQSRMSRLCEDCQRRAEKNPLRVLDFLIVFILNPRIKSTSTSYFCQYYNPTASSTKIASLLELTSFLPSRVFIQAMLKRTWLPLTHGRQPRAAKPHNCR